MRSSTSSDKVGGTDTKLEKLYILHHVFLVNCIFLSVVVGVFSVFFSFWLSFFSNKVFGAWKTFGANANIEC